MLNDHRRKAVAAVGDFGHRVSVPAAAPPSYLVILTKPPWAQIGLTVVGNGGLEPPPVGQRNILLSSIRANHRSRDPGCVKKRTSVNPTGGICNRGASIVSGLRRGTSDRHVRKIHEDQGR